MAQISQNISDTLRNVNLQNPTLSTLAKKGNESLIQRFLTENLQISGDEENKMQSQLYIASFWGFADVVKTLLENGADANAQNPDTLWTPLHAASFQEHGKVIMLLLQKKADPWLEDFEGRSSVDFGSASDKIWPLFASCGCTKTSRNVLIEKGVIRKKIDDGNVGQTGNRTENSLRSGNMNNLINYESRALNIDKTNERSAYAASIDGDVLAGDDSSMKTGDQPSFNAWR
eukprot:TCONS_00064239-protein